MKQTVADLLSKRFEYCFHVVRSIAVNSLDSRIRWQFVDSWAIRWIREFAENSLIRGQFVGFVHSGTIRWFVGNSFHSFDSLFNEWFVAANPTNELIRKKRQFASLCSLISQKNISLLTEHNVTKLNAENRLFPFLQKYLLNDKNLRNISVLRKNIPSTLLKPRIPSFSKCPYTKFQHQKM